MRREVEHVSLRRIVTRTMGLECAVRPPDDESEGPWPAVVFLHGAGAKGSDLAQVRRETLPRLVFDKEMPFPFLLACPQCPADAPGWPLEDLLVTLETLLERYPIDPARLYLTGISMGGRGTWEFAFWHPEMLAAIVPVCGPSLPTLAPRLKNLPVWTIHGALDDVVPVARTDEMVKALRATRGADVQYTRLEGIGHNCGRAAYRHLALWEWLAQQRRQSERPMEGTHGNTERTG
jgi:predicted peptidase